MDDDERAQLVDRIVAALAEWYPRYVAASGPAVAVALYTDDGAITVVPAATSDRAAALEVGDWPEPVDIGPLFDAICTSLRVHPREDFPRFRRAVLRALVDALHRAKPMVGGATLFASISDSEETAAFEHASREELA